MEVAWKEQEVLEVEKIYKSLDLSQEERDNIKFYGDFITNFIPLSSMVIQGIFTFSIQDWEQEHPGKVFASEARGSNGVKVAKEMNDFVKKRLKNLLRDPKDHQRIEEGIDTALRKFAEVGPRGSKG